MVHFDPPSEEQGIGKHHRACNPDVPIFAQPNYAAGGIPNPWHVGTGALYAVTCPDCKESAVYKEEMRKIEDYQDVDREPATAQSSA